MSPCQYCPNGKKTAMRHSFPRAKDQKPPKQAKQNKQTNKQTNQPTKQTNKQTKPNQTKPKNKQTNQTNKQTKQTNKQTKQVENQELLHVPSPTRQSGISMAKHT